MPIVVHGALVSRTTRYAGEPYPHAQCWSWGRNSLVEGQVVIAR